MESPNPEKEFDELIKSAGGVQSNFSNGPVVVAVARLGKAVVGLDRTSSRLAYVNIGLTVAVLIAAAVQIYLMIYLR